MQSHRSILLALMLVATSGCPSEAVESSDDPPAPAPAKPASSGQAPPARAEVARGPGIAADGTVVSAVKWFEGSLEEALVAARAAGKLVFVDVGAYWCPPCHRLDEEVFVRPEIGRALAQGFVAVHVDAEKGEGPDVVARHHIQAYPTLLVLEPSGLEKGRIVDYLAPSQLLAALERIARGDNVLADLVTVVEAAPDDLEARRRLGHAYALAADRVRADAQYDAVLLGDPTDEMGLASEVLFDRAMYFTYKLDRNPEGAIVAFEALQQRFPASKAALSAYRQIARLQCELGREDEAMATMNAMLARHPDDVGLMASFGWLSFREKCQPQVGRAVVERGLEHAPRNAELHYLRAELASALADDAAARESIAAAAEIEPRSAFYRRQVRRFAEGAQP